LEAKHDQVFIEVYVCNISEPHHKAQYDNENGDIQVNSELIDLETTLSKVMDETMKDKTVGVYTCAPEGYMNQLELESTKYYNRIILQREVFNW
jgi:hypothetical protein